MNKERIKWLKEKTNIKMNEMKKIKKKEYNEQKPVKKN